MRFIKNKKGLTLSELLVSLLIISIIVGMTVPNYINKMKETNVISFVEQLKTVENNVRMVASVNTDNYGHYPHPKLMDTTSIDSEKLTVNKDEGIPYLPSANKNDNQNYYHIDLGGSQPAIVHKGNDTSNKVILPHSLETALAKKYGRHAILKAFPIDMLRFSYYSPTPLKLSFPLKQEDGKYPKGYTLNGYQDGTVFDSVSLKEVFVGHCETGNSNCSSPGNGTDANDLIPNDGIYEASGYYILVQNGDKYDIFYTGTDAIYKDRYVHSY